MMSTNSKKSSHGKSWRILAAILAAMIVLSGLSAVVMGMSKNPPQSQLPAGDVVIPRMEVPLLTEPRVNPDSGMTVYDAVATVTGGTVNVRSGPSTSYKILGTVRKNMQVTVVGKFSSNWYKIKFASGYGYMSGKYLGSFKVSGGSPSVSGSDAGMTAFNGTAVTTDNLNVRKGPSTSYSKLGVLPKKQSVTLVGKFTSNWYKIKYGSSYGYVCGDYLTKISGGTTVTTAPPTTAKPTTAAPSIDAGITAVSGKAVTTDALNVRKGPNTSYSKLGVLSKGASVVLVGKFEKTNWYKIQYGNGYGYVCGDYIKVSAAATTKPTTAKPTTTAPSIDAGITAVSGKAVTTDVLNVRKGPATSYAKLGILPAKTTVTLIGKFEKTNWYKIAYGSGYGYVCGDYLKLSTTTTTTVKPNDGFQVKDTYGVTTARLNIRTAPDTKASILEVAPKGVKLHIIGTNSAGWYKIQYGTRDAYVFAEYVVLDSVTPPTTEKPATTTTTTVKPSDADNGMLSASGTAVVSQDNLNVRSGPATSYNSIGKLQANTTVTLQGRFHVGKTYWYKIKYGGGSGYISGDYLKNFDIKLNASGSKAVTGELRGVWLSYIELNFATGTNNEAICKAKVSEYFDKVAKDGMNAVFVHVRPFSDAYYKSDYFPWSVYVSGEQGKEPTYDPLKYMVEEAHKRGLELHAWVNPYRISTSGTSISKLAANNPARVWLEKNPNDTRVIKWNNGLYYNPASEDVQKLIINGVEEIVKKYDVDGVHFDDYFYPTTDASIDAADYAKYKSSGGTMTLKQWRTDNVDKMVRGCYSAVKKINNSVAFGISPQGTIENNVNELYADVYKWGSVKGYVDYLAPQIYFGFNHNFAPFDKWTDRWVNLVTLPNVKLYIGLGAYRCGVQQSGEEPMRYEWVRNTDNLARQLDYLRWTGSCDGFILYSYNSLWAANANDYAKKELKNFLDIL